MKVQRAAEKANTDAKVFCTQGSRRFLNLADAANVSYGRFIRTTDEDHKAAVEYFFLQLQQRGYIYQSKHEGWYCVSDETFYPESQIHMVIEPQTGRKIHASKETGKEVQWTSEVNYHFKLSEFRERLLQLYQDNPKFIVPIQRLNFIKAEVERGLSDLSVSRPSSRLSWGIRVPGDDSQTVYVWLDALINYITMTGYPSFSNHHTKAYWPPDCQVIGKDIIRFHTIYWPAFLMALDLPVPKRFLCHAHWTMNEEKMSKSVGNVVNPFHAMERFGVDTIRYYMVRDGGFADDASYENAFIIARYKKELQGGLGNMLSRILRSKKWNLGEVIEQLRPEVEYNAPLLPWLQPLRMQMLEYSTGAEDAMDNANPRDALMHIMKTVTYVNKYFQEAQVWQKAESSDPSDQDDVKRIVYQSADCLRVAAILLQPFMPERMKVALDMLGVRDSARHLRRALIGHDMKYGVPRMAVGERRGEDTLFPPLTSEY
jgi:methionyl-tRNA synthetase